MDPTAGAAVALSGAVATAAAPRAKIRPAEERRRPPSSFILKTLLRCCVALSVAVGTLSELVQAGEGGVCATDKGCGID